MLARAAAGEASGLARLAESQTAGRGRFGRRWLAPGRRPDFFPLLWRFECGAGQLSGLSLVVGVAFDPRAEPPGRAGAAEMAQ